MSCFACYRSANPRLTALSTALAGEIRCQNEHSISTKHLHSLQPSSHPSYAMCSGWCPSRSARICFSCTNAAQSPYSTSSCLGSELCIPCDWPPRLECSETESTLQTARTLHCKNHWTFSAQPLRHSCELMIYTFTLPSLLMYRAPL